MSTTTMATTITAMIADEAGQSLLRLMTWLSPAFPVGGFAYSGGLEAAVREGYVRNATDLRSWIETAMRQGQIRNDTILLAEAWHAHEDPLRLDDVSSLARALAGSAERYLETTAQGDAFAAAATPWFPSAVERLGPDLPYPVAIGFLAAAGRIDLRSTMIAWLHALASQLVSAAIRLGVLGQREAMSILAELEPALLEAAHQAEVSTLDDLGSAALVADIMSARHECLHSRLFRT